MRLNKLWVVSLVLLSVASSNAQGPTTITGVVERANGSLEKGAAVTFWPYGPSRGPEMNTVTDEKGEFSLTISYIGPGSLSASKVDEGYPDAVLAFYGLRDHKSVQEISPKGSSISGVLLEFDEPAPRIELAVRPQGIKVGSVVITVRSNLRPNIYGSTTWDTAQIWTFVLPKDPVTITVTAPDHEVWNYTVDPSVPVKNGVVSLTAELRESSHGAVPSKR